ncbi:hypothetical protein CRG98_048488 [Punica granatum]|uniref:Uncharacterized protein n=1 Tax=Punica granatum TaxID=22663 RepID=A0A2I0HHZ5_PUNGR|nr:hypothetical protein CRG98_048488 [Punica granatum]
MSHDDYPSRSEEGEVVVGASTPVTTPPTGVAGNFYCCRRQQKSLVTPIGGVLAGIEAPTASHLPSSSLRPYMT